MCESSNTDKAVKKHYILACPAVNCSLSNPVWKGRASLICKMSIVIEVFPQINVTVRCRRFREHLKSHGICIWKQLSCQLIFYACSGCCSTVYISSSKEQRHTHTHIHILVQTALTHHCTASKGKKTLAKHHLEGNTDKIKLKLMKLQSSTLSFSYVKSTGILA